MKLKMIIAVFLCAAMLLAGVAGCNDPDGDDVDSSLSDGPPVGNAGAFVGPGIDFNAAFSAFKPSTVMFTAGEYTATWAELFTFLFSGVNGMLANFPGVPDWNADVGNGSSFAETIIEYSINDVMFFKSLQYGSELLGAQLTPLDEQLLSESINNMINQAGSVEEFSEMLWDHSGIYSLGLFEYLMTTEYLMSRIVVTLYGEHASLIPDNEVAEIIEDGDFLMAMHILRSRMEGEDAHLPIFFLEEILEALDNYDGDDFVQFFTEVMLENTEDVGGLSAYPHGYLFQEGDMFPEFYNAVVALEIGELSGIVETEHGFHIILRLPINYDVVPIAASFQGDTRSLRHVAAFILFEPVMQEWREAIAPVFTEDFESFDFATVFAWQD